MAWSIDDLRSATLDVPDEQVPTKKVELGTVRRRKEKRYIPAVPLTWFDRACVLPGKALAVALVLWRLAKVQKTDTVVLTQAALQQHGLGRWAKYEALRALEAAGLISVRRHAKKNPEVTILYPPTDRGPTPDLNGQVLTQPS
jgi:hypothetical protein